MALAAAICAGFVGDIDAADLTGSIAIMPLIQSLLANPTGPVLFSRHSDGVFAAPAARLKAGRAEVVALLKADSEIKDDVVDEIEQRRRAPGTRSPSRRRAAQEGGRRHPHRGQVEVRVPTAVDAPVCQFIRDLFYLWGGCTARPCRSRGAPSWRRCRWLAPGTDIVSS